MANFNFTVDTKPMEDSIDGVANHVDGTTAAVIAMQTAVVIAEQKGAQKICNNVNFGFYSLIRSQISQKIATHKSKADAKIMELQQQSVSLIGIKSRMEKDYQMLASRYTKLFEGLNKALRARIFELDKPTINRFPPPILCFSFYLFIYALREPSKQSAQSIIRNIIIKAIFKLNMRIDVIGNFLFEVKIKP